MSKTTNNTEENVRVSVSSLYAQLLKKRKEEKAAKEAKKQEEKEREKEEEKAKYTKEDGTEMSKKEKRQVKLENWQEILNGLTGEDLEYSSDKKKKKKKYRQWILDDDKTDMMDKKPKKQKKKNYKKEFDPELNMLKSLVADQNRFTTDLQKRFNYAAGPAARDAVPLNKTMVELASAINVSRSNSLQTLRTIGDLKKTIAQLYHKQTEIDMKKSGSGSDDTSDLGLLGSSIIKDMGSTNPYLAPMTPPVQSPTNQAYGYDTTGYVAPVQQPEAPKPQPQEQHTVTVRSAPQSQPQPQVRPIEIDMQEFDASTWDGPELTDRQVYTENMPHDIVVFRDKSTGSRRFAAVEPGTDHEIPNFPVPSYDPSDRPINEDDHTMKGHFDDSFKVIDV